MCCGWFGSFKPLITTKVTLFCEINKAISLFFLKENSTLFHFYSLVNISTSHLAIIKTTCLVLCGLNHQKNPPKALTCSQRCQTFGSGSFGSCRLQDGLSVPWELTGLFQCILWSACCFRFWGDQEKTLCLCVLEPFLSSFRECCCHYRMCLVCNRIYVGSTFQKSTRMVESLSVTHLSLF